MKKSIIALFILMSFLNIITQETGSTSQETGSTSLDNPSNITIGGLPIETIAQILEATHGRYK